MPTNTDSIRELQIEFAELRKDVQSHDTEFERLQFDQLRERLAVLEDRVNELKKSKEEAEKRRWQFAYIFAGAVATLLVSVIVQIVLLPLVKK